MVFNFHYNKPQSRKTGKVKWSVHYNKKCHIVEKIICGVNTHSHSQKRQPVAIMKGKAKSIVIVDNTAIIV